MKRIIDLDPLFSRTHLPLSPHGWPRRTGSGVPPRRTTPTSTANKQKQKTHLADQIAPKNNANQPQNPKALLTYAVVLAGAEHGDDVAGAVGGREGDEEGRGVEEEEEEEAVVVGRGGAPAGGHGGEVVAGVGGGGWDSGVRFGESDLAMLIGLLASLILAHYSAQ